jgi:hypothetical protein
LFIFPVWRAPCLTALPSPLFFSLSHSEGQGTDHQWTVWQTISPWIVLPFPPRESTVCLLMAEIGIRSIGRHLFY